MDQISLQHCEVVFRGNFKIQFEILTNIITLQAYTKPPGK